MLNADSRKRTAAELNAMDQEEDTGAGMASDRASHSSAPDRGSLSSTASAKDRKEQIRKIEQIAMSKLAEHFPPNSDAFASYGIEDIFGAHHAGEGAPVEGETANLAPGQMLFHLVIPPMLKALAMRHMDEASRPDVLPVLSAESRLLMHNFGWTSVLEQHKSRTESVIKSDLSKGKVDSLVRVLLNPRILILIRVGEFIEAEIKENKRLLTASELFSRYVAIFTKLQASFNVLIRGKPADKKSALERLKKDFSRDVIAKLQAQITKLNSRIDGFKHLAIQKLLSELLERTSASLSLLADIEENIKTSAFSDSLLDSNALTNFGKTINDEWSKLQLDCEHDEKVIKEQFEDIRKCGVSNRALFMAIRELLASGVKDWDAVRKFVTENDNFMAIHEVLFADADPKLIARREKWTSGEVNLIDLAAYEVMTTVFGDRNVRITGHVDSADKTGSLAPTFHMPSKYMPELKTPYSRDRLLARAVREVRDGKEFITNFEGFDGVTGDKMRICLHADSFNAMVTSLVESEEQARKGPNLLANQQLEQTLTDVSSHFERVFLSAYRDTIEEALDAGRPVVLPAMPYNQGQFSGHFTTFVVLPINNLGENPGALVLYQDSYETNPVRADSVDRMEKAMHEVIGVGMGRQVITCANPMGYAPQLDGHNCGFFSIFHSLALTLHSPSITAITKNLYEKHFAGVNLYDRSLQGQQQIDKAASEFYNDMHIALRYLLKPLRAPIIDFASPAHASRLRHVVAGWLNAAHDLGHSLRTEEVEDFDPFEFRVPEVVPDVEGPYPLHEILDWGARDELPLKSFEDVKDLVEDNLSNRTSDSCKTLTFTYDEAASEQVALLKKAEHYKLIIQLSQLHCNYDCVNYVDLPQSFKNLCGDYLDALRANIAILKSPESSSESKSSAEQLLLKLLKEKNEEQLVREVHEGAVPLIAQSVEKDERINKTTRELLALAGHRPEAWLAARQMNPDQAVIAINDLLSKPADVSKLLEEELGSVPAPLSAATQELDVLDLASLFSSNQPREMSMSPDVPFLPPAFAPMAANAQVAATAVAMDLEGDEARVMELEGGASPKPKRSSTGTK